MKSLVTLFTAAVFSTSVFAQAPAKKEEAKPAASAKKDDKKPAEKK